MESTEENVNEFYTVSLEGDIEKTSELMNTYDFDITIIIKAYKNVLERAVRLEKKEDITLNEKISVVRKNKEEVIDRLEIKNDVSLLEQGKLAKMCSDFLFGYLEPFIPDYATIIFLHLCEINDVNIVGSFIDTYNEYIEYNYKHNGKNALHIACEHDNDEIVKLLLDYCDGINEQDYYISGTKKKYNNSPLHYAVENKNIYVVRLLLEYNADPDLQNYVQDTPLHIACETSDERDRRSYYIDTRVVGIVKLLLDYGANTDLQNDGEFTPLHGVEPGIKGNFEIFNLLVSYGANLNIKCNGKTMLYKRVEMNDPVGLEFLLDCGANPYATSVSSYIGKASDIYYETPLMYAGSLHFDKETDQMKNIKIIHLLYNHMNC